MLPSFSPSPVPLPCSLSRTTSNATSTAMVFSSVEVPIVSTAMRAAMTTDEDASTPAVQFDDTCVVIPDPVVQSRMPRLVRKSYSLPLWRKRSNSNPPLDTVEIAGSPEDRSGVSFTVPLPRCVPYSL